MESYVFSNEGRANAMLDQMKQLVDTYGFVSRSDANDLYGVDNLNEYRDNNYGWIDLSNAYIEFDACRLEYVLVLPKALSIY